MVKLTNQVSGKPVELNAVTVAFGDMGALVANPKQFSTGSIGMYGNGQLSDNQGNKYQIGITMTLIGSKPTETPKAKK